MTVPHKMLILGDMRELGAEGPAEHQKIVDYIKESDFEKVWLVGEQFIFLQILYNFLHICISFKRMFTCGKLFSHEPYFLKITFFDVVNDFLMLGRSLTRCSY